MKRTSFLFMKVAVLLCVCLPASAQKFFPKTIQFKGAPEYSDQELMAAAGLKKDTSIAYSEMKSHSQRLLDTGLFEAASFTFNGADLVFTLVPSTALYPVRLENLPFTPGAKLDAALHDRIPLYHGKVPFDGGLTEQVCQALEDMLATMGIKASVAATPYTDQKLLQVSAMSFAITAPRVQLGEIHFEDASQLHDHGTTELLAKLTGSEYNAEGSTEEIKTNLGNYYRDKGYLEAVVRADPQSVPVITAESIRIPFLVSVSTGVIYKLAGIHLAPDMLVSQTEFDRQSGIDPGDVADGQHVRENWQFIEGQYHNKGYLKTVIHPVASYDRAHETVSFTVSAEAGPVYRMGRLTIENGADDLRAAILAAWKMPTGAVFNESAILGFYTTHGINPMLERTIASANLKYAVHLNDEIHTVDVALRLERKR
jgi:outer membrane protein assembly factor BamA